MNPALKRFNKKFGVAADAVSRLDIDQEDRELVAKALADAFKGQSDFQHDLFVLLASDPLVPCAGFDDASTGEHHACPQGREIRIGMHLSEAPDGRSKAWRRRRPTVRCLPCGARQFIDGYPTDE